MILIDDWSGTLHISAGRGVEVYDCMLHDILRHSCLVDIAQVWLYKDKATGQPKGDCTVTYEGTVDPAAF